MAIDELLVKIQKEKDIFEKSKLILEVVRKEGVKISELSKKINLKPSYICHFIRLRKLPEIVVDGYYTKLISISHLFVIARLNDAAQMTKVYEQVLSEDLSVARTDDLVREMLHQIKNKGKYIPQDEIDEFKVGMGEKAQVKLIQTRIKGKLLIEFKGNLETTSQELRNLMRKIRS